jgi:hypothetical protein
MSDADPAWRKLQDALQFHNDADSKLRGAISHLADILDPLHSPATMETFEMVNDQMRGRLYDVFLGICAKDRGTPAHALEARLASSEMMQKIYDRIRDVKRCKAEAELREQ